MAKVTLTSIIKMLPLEESIKRLLKNFETLDADRKYDIERALWDTYYALYELKHEENLKKALILVGEDQEKLNSEFGKRALEQTDKDMEEMILNGMKQQDLAAAEEAMKLIVKEIKASKNPNIKLQ
jgi:hypothetical protein